MNGWIKKYYHLALIALVVCGSLGGFLLLISFDSRFSSLSVIVFMTGAVGAVVGNYRRLSLLSTRDKEWLDASLDDNMVTIQLYVSPLIGGIFALLLWMAFVGGLIQGALFPKMTVVQEPYTHFGDLMRYAKLDSFAEAAKVVFWGFIAGYSERFVPNIIDRLIHESQIHESRKE